MPENSFCQQIGDDELYHFAADANVILDDLRRDYRQLAEKYQAALNRCTELETALNRALAVLAAQEAADLEAACVCP